MEQIRIEGGRPLAGSVSIQGSKNAALPMMAAALLHEGVSVLHGCPKIADVFCMEEILQSLGAKTVWEGSTLILDCREITHMEVTEEYASRMRSSVILLGALLGRKGEGQIGRPGGCIIGKRPVDLHVMILRALGAVVEEKEGQLLARAARLKGERICLRFPSVGATEQAMLAAVRAEGVTCLCGCAREPEIWHLASFLKQMGAEIEGAGTDTICVRGGRPLHDVEFTVPPDRIVAGTYLCAGAATRGKVVLEGCPTLELGAFLGVYGKMGGQYERKSGTLIADSRGIRHAIPYLETAVYPGFPTDLQSPLLAVLATVPGSSHLRETIFEDRYKVAEELCKMKARICIWEKDAYVTGVPSLVGCEVEARELRGGAALLVAGLAAEGETLVRGCEYIYRGYERIREDLLCLGGKIET